MCNMHGRAITLFYVEVSFTNSLELDDYLQYLSAFPNEFNF